MSLVGPFTPFLCLRVSSVTRTLRAGGQKWIVYLSRGPRYILIRATVRERPWLCYRSKGFTAIWDNASYADREDYLVAFLRKLQRPAQGALDRPDASDPELASRFPALHEHLTRSKDDEGKPRQTCSLTVYGQAGQLKGFLNDRDSGGAIGVQAGTLAGLLGALEAELESDQPSWFWRQDQQGSGARKSRGRA